MKKVVAVFAAIAIGLTATACTSETGGGVVVVTKTVTPSPSTIPAPTTPTPVDTYSPEYQRMMLDYVWKSVPLDSQAEVCEGWRASENRADIIAGWNEQTGGKFTEEVITKFFNDKCR